MKKKGFFVLGMAILVLSLSLAFIGCDDGNGGGDELDKSGTFTAAIFKLDSSDYVSVFGTAPTGFTILTGTKSDLQTKVETAMSKSSYGELAADTGLPWSAVESAIQSELVDTSVITAANKNSLMNGLGTKGYVVGVIPLGGGEYGVAAAYRE
jgi:hypothetical protein